MKRRTFRNAPITRAWTATVRYSDGREITTTVHGSNAANAETNYLREHPDVAVVIVRSEQR